MRKQVHFKYQGKDYSGYIIDSTDEMPHYYWLFFKDVELVKKFGDSIGFKLKDGRLVPTQRHVADQEFIETIKSIVEAFSSQRR